MFSLNFSRSSDYVAPAAGRLQIGTLWTQGLKPSSVFEGMCSLGLVELLDTPYVKYFAVLGLCCACGGPLIIGTLWTQGLKLSSVFEGMRSLEHDTLLIYCNYVALQNFWLLKNSIETECGFSLSLDTCFL